MKRKFITKFISIVLCCTIIFSAFAFGTFAVGSGTNKLDLVFAIDTNRSMYDYLIHIRRYISTNLDILESAFNNNIDYRVAVVDYRDFKRYTSNEDYQFKSSGFMNDKEEIKNYLESIKPSDYNTKNSCLFHALIDGVKELNWRDDASRAVVIIGANTPRDPESVDTGYDYTSFVSEFCKKDKYGNVSSDYVIDAVNVTGNDLTNQIFTYVAHSANGLVYKSTGTTEEEIKSSFNSIFKSIFKRYPSALQGPPSPEPVQIYYKNQRVYDEINCRIPLFDYYVNYPIQLSYFTKDKKVDHVVWGSSNSNVTVNQDGVVTNTGFLFASSTITAKAYDSNNALLSTQSIKIKFYKLSFLLMFM